jgi:DNA polymerase-3 subunit delta
LRGFLEKASAPRGDSPAVSVWLLFGEEVLYKKALESLLAALLGDRPRDVAYEAVEGLNENVPTALERLNTYSLLSPGKVVAFTDARIFYSRQNLDRLWEQAAQAYRADEIKKAARYFLDLLSLQHLRMDDLAGTAPETRLKPPIDGADSDWISPVLEHCRQNGLKVPAAVDPQNDLQRAIEKGFPAAHHLVITTALVDKRRVLYKTIREKGLVVDCSVPMGDRKADRAAQEAVLAAAVAEGLQPYRKRMDPAARRALFDLTGFDLRTVVTGVEKLVHFTGDRDTINVDDVRRTLSRTRQDPLYALTEAVANRQLSPALFFLQSLLTGGDFDHPLPLLAAVTNQMRRLLVAKDFTESPYGRVWQANCSYPQFQAQVMPAIKAFDEALTARLDAWGQTLTAETGSGKGAAASKKKNPLSSDLLLAAKGRSPFPVYKILQKADRFTRAELLAILKLLSEADRRLKRSSLSGRLVLEDVILTICQTGPAGSAGGLAEGRPPGRPMPSRQGR